MMYQPCRFADERAAFHRALLGSCLTLDSAGRPSNCDKDNIASVQIAQGIARRIQAETIGERAAAQTSGKQFEEKCADFLRNTFTLLEHLRPGKWDILHISGRNRLQIANYQQYSHLVALDRAARSNPQLAAALGNDYTITPDIVVVRHAEPDDSINQQVHLVNDSVSRLANLRATNNQLPILHASISCKWTIRSDRAQNSRSEALNLVRNRKGHLPHIVVVTAEPLPSRLASIALGTGDIDCVYHFALYELQDTLEELEYPDAADMLNIMVEGSRLKDISDLPLDLAV